MNERTLFLLLALVGLPAVAGAVQQNGPDRYDATFRKYSKRYFGIAFDWRVFKAQAMAESNLDPNAHSWVGAKGLMQLMPSTFAAIQTKNPDFTSINDPEWNIAAGILFDRDLWRAWDDHESVPDRLNFMFASYNAGRTTIERAQGTAQTRGMNPLVWWSIEQVAPFVPRWRHEETLEYVVKINNNRQALDARGRVVKSGN